MPDFSSVSPKTWEEKVLHSIINGTDIGLDSQAKTLLEFQLERQAGITDIDTDFSNVSPRTAKEKLLDAIINGSSYTGSVKDFIERSLKAKLNVESIDPTQAKSYLEYLYAQGLASGEINSNLLKRYGFPYPNDYLFASFMDKETKNLLRSSENLASGVGGWTPNAFIGTTNYFDSLTYGGQRIYMTKLTDADATNSALITATGQPLNGLTHTFSCFIKKDAAQTNACQIGFTYFGGASTDTAVLFVDQASGDFNTTTTGDVAINAIGKIEIFDGETLIGWRFWLTATCSSVDNTEVRVLIFPAVRANVNAGFDSTLTGELLIGGIMYSEGSTLHDYVASARKQILVDSSGNGNDGYRGSTPNSGIIDDGERIAYRRFATSGNGIDVDVSGVHSLANYSAFAYVDIDKSTNSAIITNYPTGAADATFIFRIDNLDSNNIKLSVWNGGSNVFNGTVSISALYVGTRLKGFIGFHFVHDNGENCEVVFYWKSNKADSWTNLGSATGTQIVASGSPTSKLRLFAYQNTMLGSTAGRLYEAQFWSGNLFDGTGSKMFETNLSKDAAHGVTKFVSSSGHTVTIAQTDGTDSADGTWRENGIYYVTDDYTVINLSSLPAPFTVTVLFRTQAASTQQGIMAKRDLNDGWFLEINATNAIQVWVREASAWAILNTLASFVSTNVWYCVQFTYNGSIGELYVNGVLQESLAIAATLTNTSNIRLGSRRNTVSDSPFNGTIFEPLILAKALSDIELAAQYQAIKDYLTAQNQTAILADLP